MEISLGKRRNPLFLRFAGIVCKAQIKHVSPVDIHSEADESGEITHHFFCLANRKGWRYMIVRKSKRRRLKPPKNKVQ